MNKTQLWAKIRKEVLRDLAVNHGNCGHCEICGRDFGIGLAHRMKRRKLPSFKKERKAHEAELRCCAYLCVRCHYKLEKGDPQEMYDKITDIVGGR